MKIVKKLISRLGVGGVRIAVAALLIAALVTARLCGADTAPVKRGIEAGGSTIGVVKYVVAKYNEFTA